MNPSEQYRDVRLRMTDLVRDLGDDRLALPVPACPGWNVKDLIGHASAVVTDVVRGNLEGAGGDEWTARQVAERKDMPLDEILAEWEPNAAFVESQLDAYPKGLARTLIIDLVTHEHDLRGAIGVPGGRDSEAYAVGVKGFHVALAKAIEAQGLPGLRVTAGDGWTFDAGPDPATTLTAPDRHELFRALAGRRSRRQVLAFDWDGDPEPYLPVFSRFGSLPENDVVEAV